MASRCVKCGEAHDTRACPHGKGKMEKQEVLKCCNCGSNEHPANYQGCPKFPKNLIKKQNIPSRQVTPSISYANITQNRNLAPPPIISTPAPQQSLPTNNASNTEPFSFAELANVMAEVQSELNTNNLINLLSFFKNLLSEIKQHNRYEDKIFTVLRMLPQIGHLVP